VNVLVEKEFLMDSTTMFDVTSIPGGFTFEGVDGSFYWDIVHFGQIKFSKFFKTKVSYQYYLALVEDPFPEDSASHSKIELVSD